MPQKQKQRKANKAGKVMVNIRENIKQRKSKKNPAPGLLKTIGGLVGGKVGGPIGALVGSSAGALISEITGFGDYTVNHNTIASGNSVPTFKLASDGVEICHREFIADIKGSNLFSLSRFAINPGLASIFPWLSQVAQNFEEYVMLGLVFEYRPTSSTAVFNSSPNGAMGVVVFATDYNVLAPAFQNKQQMESYEFSSSTVPYNAMMHPVECKPRSNPLDTLWIRSGSTTLGDDRLYDLGQFEVGLEGMQAVYTIGELWVTYHVLLKKPRLNPFGLGTFAHIHNTADGDADSSNILGVTAEIDPSSNLNGVTVINSNVIQITNPGNYMLCCNITCGGADIANDIGLNFGTNITEINLFDLDANASAIASTTTQALRNDTIAVVAGTGTTNYVTFSALDSATDCNADVFVFPIPYSSK